MKVPLLITALSLLNCIQQPIEKPTPKAPEISYCDYDVDGVCVNQRDRFMNVNPSILSWGLQALEYEVNFFYPGLNFSVLAEEQMLKITYHWANLSTTHQGLYYNSNVEAVINLRKGEGITPLMECSDRYYITLHEVLHFIADRYLFETYESEDWHDVPYIFTSWAALEELPTDYTVEGRLYTLTWRMCYDTINAKER